MRGKKKILKIFQSNENQPKYMLSKNIFITLAKCEFMIFFG